MAEDLEENFPSSNFEILAINASSAESSSSLAADKADLPLLQDVDVDQDNLSDVWVDWEADWRDVQIVDENGELQRNYSLTDDGDLRTPNDYAELRKIIVDAATAGRTPASDWQNAREPLDTNLDDNVSPGDLLRLINAMNDGGPRQLTSAVTAKVDVNGDGYITASDALTQVLHLNKINAASASSEPPSSESVDAFLASLAQSQDDEEEQRREATT